MSRSRTQLRPIALGKKLPQFAPMSQPDARLALLSEIERLAKQAKQLNLADSAFILNVAHLDLKSRIHDVSDEELHAISQIIPPHA
jgi:hypothetical protein